MRYRNLGRTGLSVKEIRLSCEHLQGKDKNLIRDAAHTAPKLFGQYGLYGL